MKLNKRERKMTMNKREQGFTLIELIMVIVIMGILAAVVVPKFFSLEEKTHEKVEKAVIGNIRAGLVLYSVNQLASGLGRSFPSPSTIEFTDILDEIPENWNITHTDSSMAWIAYSGRSAQTWYYSYSTGLNPGGQATYTIGSRTTTPEE